MSNNLLTSIKTTLILTATTTTPSALAADFDRSSYNICPQVPSLRCRNGSTCIEGQAKFDPKHDPLDLQTHESGWHCDCLPGYIGHECEVAVADCESNSYSPTGSVLHSCYHGSTCRQGAGGFYCDCDALNDSSSPTASKFAGLMCEHEATSLCAITLVETSAPNNQFCTNHGKCIKMVSEDEAHPGCLCRTGWMGDHCEIQQDPFANVDPLMSQEGGNQTAGAVLFSILIVAIGLVLAAIIFIVVKSRRESRGPREKAVGKTAAEVGAGELEADGSGTLNTEGSEEQHEGAGKSKDAPGELELTETVADKAAVDAPEESDHTEKEII